MSVYDDISNTPCPNTAEEFLRLLLTNLQGLNSKVEQMETKLDRFLTRFQSTDTSLGHEEGVGITCQLLDLTGNISELSDQVQCINNNKEKSGIIIPNGELYVDPNLISNKVNSQVTIETEMVDNIVTLTEPDFVVIQPSSDICDKLGTPDFREIRSDVEQYISTANKVLSDQPSTQVFISSLPPRYDREEASRATDLWNSILVAETFVYDRVHAVPQSGLECREGKQRHGRYKENGFLLTRYGTRLLSKNIATSINEVLRKHESKPSDKLVKRSVNRFSRGK